MALRMSDSPRRILHVDKRLQAADGLPTESLFIDPHRGQRWVRKLAAVYVVKTDEAEIGWDAQA